MAKYGQFVGYTPNPEIKGAYDFQLENGRVVTAGGQDGEALRARLDAYNSVNQPQVAGPGGGFDPSAASRAFVGGGLPTPKEPEPVAEPAAPPVPAPAGPRVAEPVPMVMQPKSDQLGYGLSVSPQGTIQETVPGSPGVSQKQLQAQQGTGTPIDRNVSVTQQGGMEGDPEYLKERAQGNADQRLQLQKERDEAIAAAKTESKLAEERFETRKRLMGEEQARVADLEKRVALDEDLKNRAFAEYTSSKVNPDRIFANPGSRVLAALAAAGGAYAATIAKTPNFALDIINQSIDRDIRAQEAAIRIKGDKHNNLLSELRKSGMDLAQARAAAKGIMFEHEGAQLALNRARNAVPALESYYEKLDLAKQEGLREANEAYRQATIGKTTRTTNSVVEYPRAGSAGGRRDVRDQLGAAAKLQALQKGEADIAKANRDAQKGPNASPELRKVDQSLAGLASDQERLKNYGDNEKPPTPGNRNIIGRAVAGATNFVAGEGTYENNMLSERDKQFIQDFEGAKTNLVAAISVANQQGAMQEGERKEAEKKIAAAGTVAELKRAQAWVRDRLEKQREAAEVNPGPAMEVTK